MSFSKQILELQTYAQTDIVKKYKKYPQFQQQLNTLEEQYVHDLNMAIYADLDSFEEMGIFQIHNKNHLFVNFYGYIMPPFEEYASKFYMLWIRTLDELLRLHIGKTYTIVYFNSLSDSNYPYNFLVEIFKKLPIYYYAMLDKIYLIESTFFMRTSAGLFDFGRLYKLFDRKIQAVQKISHFASMDHIVKSGILDKLPDKLMYYLEEKKKKKMLKQLKKQQLEETSIKYQQKIEKAVVVIPQKLIVKKDCLTIELQAHKLNKDGLPLPLIILIQTLKTHSNLLQLEGIFRKSGSIEEEEEIIEQLGTLQQGQQLQKNEQYSGYAIAGVVKKFFTKLSTPLVPYSVYDNLLHIMTQSQIKPEEQMNFLLDFLNQLPSLNRKVMIYLISFFRFEVVTREEQNKMNAYNMSVCLCPCLFRAENPSLSDLMNSGRFAGILNILFKRFEEVMKIQERGSGDSDEIKEKKNLGGNINYPMINRISTA